MNEAYVELLVKRKSPVGPNIARAILGVLTVLCLVVGLGLSPFIFLFSIVFGIGTYVANLSADIEYEYLYVDRELDVDIIRSKSRRKRIASFELNRMELFAPLGSDRLKEYDNRELSVRDFSSKLEDSNPYVMIYMGEKKLQKVIIECNDELYKCFYSVAPRKVFKD